ncbi:hypothetical protein H1R20_g4619, partial [Candolleomyces eurysporus]
MYDMRKKKKEKKERKSSMNRPTHFYQPSFSVLAAALAPSEPSFQKLHQNPQSTTPRLLLYTTLMSPWMLNSTALSGHPSSNIAIKTTDLPHLPGPSTGLTNSNQETSPPAALKSSITENSTSLLSKEEEEKVRSKSSSAHLRHPITPGFGVTRRCQGRSVSSEVGRYPLPLIFQKPAALPALRVRGVEGTSANRGAVCVVSSRRGTGP